MKKTPTKAKTSMRTKIHVITGVVVGLALFGTAALWAMGPVPLGKIPKGRSIPGYGIPGYSIPGYGVPGYGIPGGYRP